MIVIILLPNIDVVGVAAGQNLTFATLLRHNSDITRLGPGVAVRRDGGGSSHESKEAGNDELHLVEIEASGEK